MKKITLKTLFLLFSLIYISNVSAQYNDIFLYLPLDGNSKDSSASGYNAILYSGNFTADRNGKANKALNLDGVDDYLLIKNIGNLLPTNDYKISFWLKMEKGDQKSANTFMLLPDSTSNRYSASIYYSHSGTSSHFVDFGPISNRMFFQPDLPDGNWNFFEIIMTTDTLKLFKNNTLISLLSPTNKFVCRTGDLAIGMGKDGFIKGIIDEFKISIKNTKSNRLLVNGFLYLPLDGNSLDSTINKRDADMYGNPKFVADRNGNSNKALSLDGNDDYLLIKGLGDSLLTNNYSISFWLKMEKGDQKSANTFMLLPDNTSNRYSVSIYYSHSGTSSHFVDFGSINNRLFYQPDLPDGNWNYFEIIMTKNYLNLYKNGTLIKSLSDPDHYSKRNGDFAIGMGVDGYIKGIIDEFKINTIQPNLKIIDISYNNNIKIYPNPNYTSEFNIDFLEPTIIYSVSNELGQNINYEFKNQTLKIDSKSGIYFLKCISNNKIFIKKLVINN